MISGPRALGPLLLLAVLLGTGLGGAPAAWAANASDGQEVSPPGTPMNGSGGLDPIEERRLKFLFWGYTVIWILLAVYLVSISLRLRSVRRELGRLRERLDRRAAGSGGSPPA